MDETEAAVAELDEPEFEFDALVVEFSRSAKVDEESKELRSDVSEVVELMISP
jgi:hypothetical protein